MGGAEPRPYGANKKLCKEYQTLASVKMGGAEPRPYGANKDCGKKANVYKR